MKEGTRSRDGKPGPNYWQNHADYDISVRLDTSENRIYGSEKVVYFNNSNDTIANLVLRLYQNRLKKGAVRIVDSRRPQEPVKPYPYYEEEVVFKNREANVTLAGTLTLPNKDEKFPVVILISGSGPQDRDESFMGHKPFLVLADYLTKQGIGVLRFDDRGHGKSTGDFGNATTEDFSKDVLSAVAYLKTRSDVDIKKIGFGSF